MKSLIFVLCLFLCGCTMHDTYYRPDVTTSQGWRWEVSEKEIADTADWWKLFNDPVLDEYVERALLNNQDLKVAISRVNEFIANLQIVSSQLFPQVSATAEAGRTESSLYTTPLLPGTQRINNIYSLIGNVSYLVDLWGQVRSETEVATAQLLAQEDTQKGVVLGLVTAVASTYIQWRQFGEEWRIAHETVASRRESYRLAKLRYELGLTSEMPVMQSLSELDFTENQEKQAELLTDKFEDLLCTLMGEPPKPLEKGLKWENIAMPPSIPEGLPSDLLNQRPDILAAEQLLVAANANIGVAKAAFFPQISLTGSYGKESLALNNFFLSPATTWAYGITLLQEIFTGGSLTGNLKLARAQRETALHQYQSTILTAFREVNDALISHRIAKEQIVILDQRVQALTVYYELAVAQYKEGEVDYLNVLDAERQLFLTQLDDVQAHADGFISLIDIYRALGGSWVDAANQSLQECQ